MSEVPRTVIIAVHEAAHATIGRALLLPLCGEASIHEPDAHARFCTDSGLDSIVTLMAGCAAERLFFGDNDPHGSSNDIAKVRALLDTHGGDIDELWDRARTLVRAYQCEIAVVAMSLLANGGALTGDAIDALLEPA